MQIDTKLIKKENLKDISTRGNNKISNRGSGLGTYHHNEQRFDEESGWLVPIVRSGRTSD